MAVIGIILVVLFAIMAISHPILLHTVWARSIYDPTTGFDSSVFSHPTTPTWAHLLGTDTLGRDVFSRLLSATTPTFIIGLTAAIATALIGLILSMCAAYFGGSLDTLITNLADIFLLFPAPIMMIIIGARYNDLNPYQLGLIYGVIAGAGNATIVLRAHAIQISVKPFVEAAKIAGGNAAHNIYKHFLPNILPLAALQMMIAVTGAVVADGFISFFGIVRHTNNWGTIIYDSFVYANISPEPEILWHILVPPAVCFSLFAFGFYLISRGLHLVADPKLRSPTLS